jgi:hypothetical protein
MALSKMASAYWDQKAQLEARLKDVFQCTSSALLARRQTPTRDAFGSINFSPANPPEIPKSEPSSFLETLRVEAEKSFPDFPQNTAIEIVLRVSIYLLDVVWSASLSD